jgi:hypothetical protein
MISESASADFLAPRAFLVLGVRGVFARLCQGRSRIPPAQWRLSYNCNNTDHDGYQFAIRMPFFRTANNRGIAIVRFRESRLDAVAVSRVEPDWVRPIWAQPLRRSRCQLKLAWPPDPLTRLLMDADGVTESELDGLLRRVVEARADG